MRKFSFSLQKVLEYREHVEEELAAELARREEAAERERRALLRLEEEYRRIREELKREQEARRIDLPSVELRRFFLIVQAGRIAQQKDLVLVLDQAVEECRQRLIKARQETEALKQLREKKFLAYRKECLSEEQAFLDETGLRIFFRQAERADAGLV